MRGQTFYQHRAPDEVPPSVPVETLADDDVPSRLVGGKLKTLLYITQLAAISEDPWFSRASSRRTSSIRWRSISIPMPGTSFETVLDIARWLRDELNMWAGRLRRRRAPTDSTFMMRMPPQT